MLLMRKLALNALLAAAFECICLTAVDAQQPTTGEWVGRINLTSHPSLVRILIKADQAHGAVASMWMFPPPPTFPGQRDVPINISRETWSIEAGQGPS